MKLDSHNGAMNGTPSMKVVVKLPVIDQVLRGCCLSLESKFGCLLNHKVGGINI